MKLSLDPESFVLSSHCFTSSYRQPKFRCGLESGFVPELTDECVIHFYAWLRSGARDLWSHPLATAAEYARAKGEPTMNDESARTFAMIDLAGCADRGAWRRARR